MTRKDKRYLKKLKKSFADQLKGKDYGYIVDFYTKFLISDVSYKNTELFNELDLWIAKNYLKQN